MARLQLLDLVTIIVCLKLVTSSPTNLPSLPTLPTTLPSLPSLPESLLTSFPQQVYKKNFLNNLKIDVKILTQELRSLTEATEFQKEKESIDEKLSFAWCKNQQGIKNKNFFSSLDLSQKKKFTSKINFSEIICLDLQANEIEELKNLNLFNLSNLEYLNLGKNKIHLRELQTFQHSTIRTLILDDNYQTSSSTFGLPSDEIYLYFQLPNLEILSMRNFTQSCFQEECKLIVSASSKRVTHLILSENKITALQIQFDTKSLAHLQAENCQLKKYSSTKNQDSLTYLSLAGNYFNNLSLDFQYNPNLQFLSLSNCHLYYFDQTILKSNGKLQYLDLSRNELTFLSKETFESNVALKMLNLNTNRLANVPNLSKLVNLKKLLLGDNKIQVVEKNSFLGLVNLERLSLRGNEIYFIDNSFDELINLRSLDLSGNSVKNFRYHSTLSSLRFLLLADNLISSAKNIEIGDNVKLEYLDLVQNSKVNDKEYFSFRNVTEFIFFNFCRQRGIC